MASSVSCNKCVGGPIELLITFISLHFSTRGTVDVVDISVFIGFTQIDHTALNTSLTSARKVKWLRERMIGSSTETLLMNRIKEFILHDEPIDVEKLRKCLHRQVCHCQL